MRWGVGCLALVAILSACSEGKPESLARLGCGPVIGLDAITGEKAPAWVLVGEFTETAEAPAAIADIACNLAADNQKLFVGVMDYAGGATDAETKMLARLDALIAKGAPIIVGHIGGDDYLQTVYNRSKSEKAWARKLTAKVAASGARRALLFLSGAEAVSESIPPIGDRFAGYDPMPVFLEGGVVSLEIASRPAPGASSPTISLYPARTDGFDGQLAFASLTRPNLALVLPERGYKPTEPQETGPPGPNDKPRPVPTFNFGNISPITPEEYQALYDQLLQAIPNRAPD